MKLDKKNFIILILVILISGLILRITKAYFAPITYDEAFSYLRFSKTSIGNIFTDYSFPNNHILNSLGMKVFGLISEKEIFIRIPTLIGSAIFLIAAAILFYKALGVIGTLFLVSYISFQPFILNFGSIGRGYQLGIGFYFLGLSNIVNCIQKKKFTKKEMFLTSIFFMLSMGSVPVFVNAVSAVFASLFIYYISGFEFLSKFTVKMRLKKFVPLMVYLIIPTIVLTKLWYINIKANPSSFPWGHTNIYNMMKETLIHAWKFSFFENSIFLFLCILFVIIFIPIVYAYKMNDKINFFLSLIAPFMISAILIEYYFLKIKLPFPRTWQYIFPFFIYGLYQTIKFLLSKNEKIKIYGISVLTVLMTVWHLSFFDLKKIYPWIHLVPVKQALVSLMKEKSNPNLCFFWVYDLPFEYYKKIYNFTHNYVCNKDSEYVFTSASGKTKLDNSPSERIVYKNKINNTVLFKIRKN